MEKRIEFLYSAISDAQDIIRFIDTKTAFAITVLGAYIFTFFSLIDKIIKSHFCDSWLFLIIFLSFIIMIVINIFVTIRIIKPTHNPADNILLGSSSIPSLKYVHAKNDYSKSWLHPIKNSSDFKLSERFDSYYSQIAAASDNDIIDSLTFELLKVSFIRNIKCDRFNILVRLLLTTAILLLLIYLILIIR